MPCGLAIADYQGTLYTTNRVVGNWVTGDNWTEKVLKDPKGRYAASVILLKIEALTGGLSGDAWSWPH